MSETTIEAPLTITLKAGGGYDVPWIVVRADSPDDAVMKLDNLNEVIASTIAAANQFHLVAGGAQQLPDQAPALAVVHEQPKAAWGQSASAQSAPVVQAQHQGAATGPRGERLHPEGKTCDICPKPLMEKKTQTGKLKWQCEDWRWNNGNPNGHTAEFQN